MYRYFKFKLGVLFKKSKLFLVVCYSTKFFDDHESQFLGLFLFNIVTPRCENTFKHLNIYNANVKTTRTTCSFRALFMTVLFYICKNKHDKKYLSLFCPLSLSLNFKFFVHGQSETHESIGISISIRLHKLNT